MAIETHASFLAASTAFNGTKGGHLETFMKSLVGEPEVQIEQRPTSLAELVAMGQQLMTDEAAEARAEREAEQAAMMEAFERRGLGSKSHSGDAAP